MIRAGIIGSTGYAGGELVRILLGHKDVRYTIIPEANDQKYASFLPNIFRLVFLSCQGHFFFSLYDSSIIFFFQ